MNISGAFQPVTNLMFNNVAELAIPLESVAGFTRLTFGPLPEGAATPTGLVGATTYYVKHQIDGAVSATEISFAGSTALTFGDLVTALGATGATVTLDGSDIVLTSTTTGTTSKVVITAGTTGADLLSSVRYGQSVYLKDNTSEKGHVKYLRWNQLDSLEQAELAAILNTLDTGDTEWTFATAGMSIAKDAATAISMFDGVLVAAGVYTLDVTVDGTTKTVSFDVDGGATIDNAYESFALAMRAAFPMAGVAETQYDANTIRWMVTSPTPGVAGEAVVAAGTGNDFIAAVSATALVAAAVVEVDGVDGLVGSLSDGTPIAATAGKAYVTSDVVVAAGDTALYGPGIATVDTLVSGSGYDVDGAYTGVALTGGTGVGATADITVSGGAVTVVTLVSAGKGYTISDTLSAADGDLGGRTGGAAFSVSVATLAAAPTYYFKVAVDGAAAVEYSVSAASASYTFTTAAALLDAAAGLDAAGVDVTFDDATDRFVFTRKTTGATTSVAVTAGTTGTDVFVAVAADSAPTTFTNTAVAGTNAIADASFMSVLGTTKAPNGFPVLTSVGPTAIFEREDKPQMRYLPIGDGTYYNGSAWVVWPA